MKITYKLFMATALASVVLTGLFGQPTFANTATKTAKTTAAIQKKEAMAAKYRALNAARMQRFAAAKAARRAQEQHQADTKEGAQDHWEDVTKARHHAPAHKK